MKLGLWNRLSIVLATIGVPGFATWMWYDQNHEQSVKKDEWDDYCYDSHMSVEAGSNYQKYDDCRELFDPSYVGSEFWLEAASIGLILVVIIYALAYTTQWVIRWVWQGRNEKTSQSAK